jgi:RNA polymerase sigma-70 factor (ECF subfamily)
VPLVLEVTRDEAAVWLTGYQQARPVKGEETVARHILAGRLRVRTATPAGTEPSGAEPAVRDHQEEVVERISVLDALACLSPEHRMAIVEVHYSGRTVGSVAESLGVPAGTVRSRLFSGLRQLRAVFGSGRFGEDEVAG